MGHIRELKFLSNDILYKGFVFGSGLKTVDYRVNMTHLGIWLVSSPILVSHGLTNIFLYSRCIFTRKVVGYYLFLLLTIIFFKT